MLENMVNFYLAPNLPADRHAFFGRNGGVSEGIYASFNFNRKSRDKAENIEKNLELVGRFYGLPGNAVMRPCQGHTDKAVYVDRPSRYEIEADGVVTDRPGIILGITTADCMPVLLADEKHGVIGAAHAGWRGALAGVIENTVKVMLEKGAAVEDITAAAGPCLQKESFEVQNDMTGTKTTNVSSRPAPENAGFAIWKPLSGTVLILSALKTFRSPASTLTPTRNFISVTAAAVTWDRLRSKTIFR